MSNPGPGSGDIFDVKKVRRLVEMMKEHDLAEIDLRQGDQRVRLRRGAEPNDRSALARCRSRRRSCRPPRAGGGKTGHGGRAGVELATVKSPMVGTFYAAADPDRRRL